MEGDQPEGQPTRERTEEERHLAEEALDKDIAKADAHWAKLAEEERWDEVRNMWLDIKPDRVPVPGVDDEDDLDEGDE